MHALVTGASRGIGKAVAAALATQSRNLVLVARDMAGLEATAQEIRTNAPNCEILLFAADLSERDATEDLLRFINHNCDGIDVLVNNVGMYAIGTLTAEPAGAMEQALSTNFYSAYYLSRPIATAMKARKSGYIFNICSVLSREIRPDAASYTISKQALYSFSKLLSAEMREHGVKVSAILPGSVNTSSWDGINAPKQAFVQPQDVAEAIVAALNMSSGAWMEDITVRPLLNGY